MTVTTQNSNTNSVVRSIVFGSLTATTELLTLGHILDRIKTHQQAYPAHSAGYSAKLIYQENGVSGFYKGLKWNVLTHGGKAGFRWAVMGRMDELISTYIPKEISAKYSTLQPTLLGLSVGFLEATILVCPAESFKTKEMTHIRGQGLLGVVKHIQSKGLRVCYEGYDVVVIRQGVSWASFFVAYKKSKEFALELNDGKKLNLVQQFGVGAAAGGINVLFTTPFDTIKTQMQKTNPVNGKYFFIASREFVREYGFASLYAGLGVRMVRSTWYAGLTLTLMERFGMFRSHHA